MKYKVCILYGFAEGKHTGKVLRTALLQQGFETITSPETADVIIAHSGGCYLVPAQHQAKIIMYIGIPYWPGKPLLQSIFERSNYLFKAAVQTRKIIPWLQRLSWNAIYTCRFVQNVRMLKKRSDKHMFNVVARSLIVVRNKHDAFCTPNIAGAPFTTYPIFMSLPGEHDDCWTNPKPYIDIIKIHERILAEAN